MLRLPAYVGIILKKDDKVLLVKRCNTDWGEGEWNFPGGLLEVDETILEAAVREAEEEIGVIIDSQDLRLVHVIQVRKSDINTKDIFGFYFMTSSWQNEPINKEPHKHTEVGWFALDSFPEKSTLHAQQALEGLKNNNQFSIN